MSQANWVNVGTKWSRVNHFLRNGKPRMMDVTSLQWACGTSWQTAVLTVDGNNFPDKLCICLVISFLQLMSCHLELLTGFSAQHEDFGLLICQSENQAVAATAVWACSVEYTMLAAEGKMTVWNTPDASSILSTLLSMKSRLCTPLKWNKQGLVPPCFPTRDHLCLGLCRDLGECSTLLHQQAGTKLSCMQFERSR